jgi:hypothetical protein
MIAWENNVRVINRIKQCLPVGREQDIIDLMSKLWKTDTKLNHEEAIERTVIQAIELLTTAVYELDRIDKIFLGSAGPDRVMLGRARDVFEKIAQKAIDVLKLTNYTEYVQLASKS